MTGTPQGQIAITPMSTLEEAALALRRLLVSKFGVSPERVFLLIGELFRNQHPNVHEHVATTTPTETRHPFLRKAVHGLRLCPRGEIDALRLTIDDRGLYGRAEDSFTDPDLDPVMKLVADPFETIVVLDADLYVDVTRRRTSFAGSALSGESEPGSVFNAARDVKRDRTIHGDQTAPLALRTRMVDRLPLPSALRARGHRHDSSEERVAGDLNAPRAATR